MSPRSGFIFAVLFSLISASNVYAFDDLGIKDPKACTNLMSALLSSSPSDSLYKMSPISPDMLESGNLGSNAGRYEYIEIGRDRLSDLKLREKVINSEGRLFYKGSGGINEAQEFFDTWVESPKVVFAIPDDAETIKNVYGKSIADADINTIKKQMNRVQESLVGLDVLETTDKSKDINAQYIFDLINADTSDTLVIVGHNQKGNLKLPGGESVNIAELQNTANEKHKTLLIVSCNSFDHVSSDFQGLVSIERLNFESIAEGLKLAESKRCNFTECTIFMGDYVYYMDEGIAENVNKNKNEKLKVKLVIAGISGSTATSVFVVTQQGE